PPLHDALPIFKSQETYRHIAYIYHVNMKKAPTLIVSEPISRDLYRFYFVPFCLIQTTIFATNSRNISAVIYGSLAAAKKQIAKAVSPREHFVAMPPHVSLSKWVSIILAIPIKCSLGLTALAICFLAAAREPYITALMFLLFVAKIVVWIKQNGTK